MKCTRISAGNYEVIMSTGSKWEVMQSDELSAPYNWIAIDEKGNVIEPQKSKKNLLIGLSEIEARQEHEKKQATL